MYVGERSGGKVSICLRHTHCWANVSFVQQLYVNVKENKCVPYGYIIPKLKCMVMLIMDTM